MLNIIIMLITINIYFCGFVFFLFKNKNISAFVLATLFSSISSMIGFESAKTLISIFLVAVVLSFAFLIKRQNKGNITITKIHVTNPLKKVNPPKYFIFEMSLFCLYFYFISLISPAIGSDYFFRKFLFTNLLMILPSFSILLLEKKDDFEPLFKFVIIPLCFFLTLNILDEIKQFGLVNIFASEWFVRTTTSEIINPIWMARFLSIGLLSTVVYIQSIFLNILIILLLFLGIFFSGSKAVLYGSLLGICLIALLNWAYNRKNKQSKNTSKTFFKVIPIMALLFLVLYLLFSNMNPLAFARRFSLNCGTEYSTVSIRQYSTKTTLDSWHKSNALLIGNGFATVGKSLGYGFSRHYPHNLTVELMFEMGLIGTFLYYLPFLHLLFLNFKKRKTLYKSKDFILFSTLTILFMLYAQTSGDFYANSLPYVFISCAAKSLEQ